MNETEMKKHIKDNLWRTKWGKKNITWLVLTFTISIFLILWNYSVIPIPHPDTIFNYFNIYLFGFKIDSFKLFIIIVIFLMIGKTITTFLGGIIGESIKYIYTISLYLLIFTPFAFIKIGLSIQELNINNVEAGLDIAWMIIIVIIIYTIVFVVTILSILTGKYEEDEKIMKKKTKKAEPIEEIESPMKPKKRNYKIITASIGSIEKPKNPKPQQNGDSVDYYFE